MGRLLRKFLSPDGFTFIEIVVAVAVTAIIGSTVYVTLAGSGDRAKVDESYAIMRDLTRMIDRFDTATACLTCSSPSISNGRHPRSLWQLNNALTATQTTNCTNCTNLCNVAYSSSPNVIGWAGPYFQNRDITVSAGFRIPIGLVRDSLLRVPSATPADQGRTYGVLQIQIDSVAYVHALDLKTIVDASTDTTSGVVRWSINAVNGVLQSIYWTLPLAGC